jgi:integrase
LVSWLTKHYGHWGAEYWNLALSVIRSALDMAVADRIIIESPAKGLKYRKRKKPIRLTPTFEQFQQIVDDIRGQRFNADAKDSSNLIQAMGLLGLGTAELANMKREHVRLDAGQIDIFRRKTGQAFTIPIFPQAYALVERLCKGKKHNERLFSISQARKALAASCRRLGFPSFTHRSLRRMFITRAIEKGVDVKVIAEWQGHRDGGKLILATYSHVRPEHSTRMAQLMTDETPSNVVSIETAQA